MFRLFKLFFLILLVLVTTEVSFADTTSVLRPVADGGNNGPFWETQSSTSCDLVDCYIEVDDESGTFCTDSDGDTSYVVNLDSGIPITFDLNEATIPNGALITQIDVTSCVRRDTAAGGDFQTRYCIDGSCSNSGVSTTILGTYDESTQYITTDFAKGALSDIEIGIVDTTNKDLRLSQISAIITYTVSTDNIVPSAVDDLQASNATASATNLFWTSPGDDIDSGTAYLYDIRYSESTITDINFSSAIEVSGEPTPSVAGSSESMNVSGLSPSTRYSFAIKTEDETSNISDISNITFTTTGAEPVPTKGTGPTSVKFSGMAYPESTIEILRKSIADEIYRNVPSEEMVVNEDGTFTLSYTGLLGSDYLFALRVKDINGIETGILSFNADLLRDNLTAKDLIIPPTLDYSHDVIRKGSNIELKGYSTPGSLVVIDVDGEVDGEVESDITGYWNYLVNTNSKSFGNHNIRVKQILPDKRESDFSKGYTVKISSLVLPEADFNEDEQIDIADWSVFLFRWGSENKPLKSSIDFDNDGTVNIYDFSIFLESFIL